MRKMKCAGYAREDSWKGGITVPATSVQLSDISEYVGRHTEMELTAVYSDRAGSVEFYKMVKDGLEGRFECVAFRSIYFAAETFSEVTRQIKEILYAAGIHILVVDERYTSIGKTKPEVHAYFAEKLRERHTDVFREWRASRGKDFILTNSVPFGYVRRNGDDRMTKDSLLQKVMDDIFEKVRSGAGMGEIAGWLNRLGIDTPGVWREKRKGKDAPSKDWTAEMVRRTVTNPVYTGAKVNGRHQVTETGCHEPYLSAEEFKKIFPGKYLMAGKESTAKPERDAGRRGLYIKGYRSVNKSEIEEKIAEEVKKECFLAKKMERIIRSGMMERIRAARRDEAVFKVRQFAARTELGQMQRISLYKDFQNGKITAEEYKARRKEMQDAYRDIDRQIDEALKEMEKTDKCFSLKNPWLVQYVSITEFSSDALRRNTDCISVDQEGKLNITFCNEEWRRMLLEGYRMLGNCEKIKAVTENGEKKQKTSGNGDRAD